MLLVSLALIIFGLVGIDGQPIEHETADKVLYDQRQSGKYNIHVSIKDVAIIEVDQNEIVDEAYNDEDDYYYDDSALTIKPIKFTTESGESTTTTRPTTTTTTTAATTAATTSSTISDKPKTTSRRTTTISTPTTTEQEVEVTTTSTPTYKPINLTAYSANLLSDIAASRIRPKSKTSNLIIMETPIGGSSTPSPMLPLRARAKDVSDVAPVTRPVLPENIEYTPPQGHNSPIFKVKVQRAASEIPMTPARCHAHQFRDVNGKCRNKRSGSILRKLFSMLVSLPFAGEHRRGHGHGHGLEVSSHHSEG